MRRLVLLTATLLLFGVALCERPTKTIALAGMEDSAIVPLEAATSLDVQTTPSAPPLREELAQPILEMEDSEEGWMFEANESDPVESGPCTLELRFFNAETAEPASGTVQLWRIRAPATRYWESGDQLQTKAALVDGILLIPDLPAGEYRTYATFGRRGSPMESSFQVEGEKTLVERFVFMPMSEKVQLQLVDLHGFPIESTPDAKIEMRRRGRQYFYTDRNTPPWLKQRYPKGNGELVTTRMGGGFSSSNHQRWKIPFWLGSEIDLGTLESDSRESSTEYGFLFRKNEASSTKVLLNCQGTGTYVALFANATELQEHIVFPAGSLRIDLVDSISITSVALPIPSSMSTAEAGERFAAHTWRDATIRIQIDAKGFQPFDFRWKPNDGPLPELYLQSKPQKKE